MARSTGGSDAFVENCTFTNNSTPGNAGALWVGDGNVAVRSSTFSGNDADYGPVFFKGSSGTLRLQNVIVANNTTANEFSALACHETFEDGGGNIQWPATKNNGNADTPCTEGVLFADPGLLPLAENGGLTQTMALALAPRIRVNAIGPGPALPSPRQTPEQFARQAHSVPLRHGTSPEEVARALIAILALPSMTGQMIALDGGQHMQWAPSLGAEPEE